VPLTEGCVFRRPPHCNTLQHTATRCNTRQHKAIYCNTLQHAATHRSNSAKKRREMHFREHPAATHCNTLFEEHPAATCCNTLQRTATHCNTLQHTDPTLPTNAVSCSLESTPKPLTSSELNTARKRERKIERKSKRVCVCGCACECVFVCRPAS